MPDKLVPENHYGFTITTMVVALAAMIITGVYLGFNLNTQPSEYKVFKLKSDRGTEAVIDLESPKEKAAVSSDSNKTLTLHTTRELFFHYQSKFLLWLFTLCLFAGISWGVLLPAWVQLKKISRYFDSPTKKMSLNLVAGVLVTVFVLLIAGGAWVSLISKSPYYLSIFSIMEKFEILIHNPKWGMVPLIFFIGAGGMVALSGLFMVNSASAKLFVPDDPKKTLQRFGELTRSLNFFLAILAIIVTGTVITTALGRESLLQALPKVKELLLPGEFVYLYGAVFTVFLALVYLPVYYQLKRLGASLTDFYQTEKEGEEKDQKSGAKKHELPANYQEVLALKANNIDTIKVGLAIFGPIITTWLTKFLGA